MKIFMPLFIVFSMLFSFTALTFAESVPVSVVQPAPSASVATAADPTPAPTIAAPAQSESAQSFLDQVLQAIKNFGGLSTVLKISTVILLIIGSMKVSILNQLIWSKLGAWQTLVAPLLGLVAGILDLNHAGTVTLASVMAYVGSGAGAILLHELLDSIKKIPGIGPTYVSIIDFVNGLLKGPDKADKQA